MKYNTGYFLKSLLSVIYNESIYSSVVNAFSLFAFRAVGDGGCDLV